MESIDIELSDDELNTLKAAANKMGVSLNKYVEIKLQQAMTDGTLEKIDEEIKAFPGCTLEETKAYIEGERQMAEEHLKMLEAKEQTNKTENEQLSFAKRSFPNYEWHSIEDILPAKEENGNLIVQLDQGIFPWRVNCSYKHFNEGYAFVDINGNKFPDELKVSCWAYLKEKCI